MSHILSNYNNMKGYITMHDVCKDCLWYRKQNTFNGSCVKDEPKFDTIKTMWYYPVVNSYHYCPYFERKV